MLTENQVQDQKIRFDNLMQSINLAKLGSRVVYFIQQDGDETWNLYNYIHKVLGLLANVGGSYYYPGENLFYCDKIKIVALNAYFSSIKNS